MGSGSTRSHLLIFALFLAIALIIHLPYVGVPFFWDELGQFVPAALDIYKRHSLVPVSTVPNVHPPGVMMYLAGAWSLAGYSIASTRVAMLVLAALAYHAAFLLAIRMCRPVAGAPAFGAALLLIATPLVFMQSMMAQLDMPAMLLTTVALLLFLEGRIGWCVAASTALVLVKETGIVVPLVCGGWLAFRERRPADALLFVIPAAALSAWLVTLYNGTGQWLGDAGFAHYNVGYALSPVRVTLAFLRRFWFLFFADFRWIATVALLYALRRTRLFFTREWLFLGIFAALQIVMVTALGGATLERYLLPVWPVWTIAAVTAFSALPERWRSAAPWALGLGLVSGLYWNPPYPFPHENNLAMVDFVSLEQAASEILSRDYSRATVATAWPYTGGLYNPELGYVTRRMQVIETSDLHASDVLSAGARADVVVVYSRTLDPPWSVTHLPFFEALLKRYYDDQPQVTRDEIEERLGMTSRFRFDQRGQFVEVFSR